MGARDGSLGRYGGPMLALILIGVVLRLSNVFWYPLQYGFDAAENWRYIERLTHSWRLPAPDADWATAHPPLFYYVGGALGRVLEDPAVTTVAMRLLGSAAGLGIIALAYLLVRRTANDDPKRAFLAAALLLFLPAQIYMSAMLSEELWAAFFSSLAITAVALQRRTPAGREGGLTSLGAAGAAAGLGLLTKLSAAITVAAGGLALLLRELPGRGLRSGLTRAFVFAAAASVVGGGFYLRNLIDYGSPYPQSLATHSLMFEMPPGERELADYLTVPLETFTNPRMDSEALVDSVWGGTYASLWYDAHRHFLPSNGEAVRIVGCAILILALVPTFAFFHGVVRGVRRLREELEGPDLPLLLLFAGTIAGYAYFTWQNPWFPVVKGSYLLSASLPFAFYTSEALSLWTSSSRSDSSARRAIAFGVWISLGTLALLVTLAFTQGLIFSKIDAPGFQSWGKP